MVKNIENKLAKSIAKKNTDSYAKIRSNFKFYSIFFCGFLIGLSAFYLCIKSGFKVPLSHIKNHFSGIFIYCETLSDYFIDVIIISKNDLRNALLIFISGFTYFCFALSSITIFSKGIITSFTIMCLFEYVKSSNYKNAFAVFFIFTITKILICFLYIHFATKSYIFSFDFRSIKQNYSILRRAPMMYNYIFSFVIVVGASLLLSLIYCSLVYLLK